MFDNINELFNKEVDKAHDALKGYIKWYIYKLKSNYGLSDKELTDLFKTDEEDLSDFLHDRNWDGCIDSRFLCIVFLLKGYLSFENTTYKKPKNLEDITKEYIDYVSTSRTERNLKELFNLLEIEDDEDLEITINQIKNILKEKQKNVEEEYY